MATPSAPATIDPAVAIGKLLKQLKATKDRSCPRARAIRRALRKLGHRGGAR